MKPKRTAPPRRRVSFAVDRDEIEINSDWVDAVMNPAPVPPLRKVSPSSVVHFPAPVSLAPTEAPVETNPADTPSVPLPPAGASFFVAEENNATGAESATGERCTSVEDSSAVDQVAPVVQIAAVENRLPVERSSTVAVITTVEHETTVENDAPRGSWQENAPLSVENNATVEYSAADAESATGALSTSTKDHRVPRPRPILRVTDGLTPGQYAVYSLMYEAGEGTASTARIYKGGYADLGRLTGLSKRGIQNIVAELQAKRVISIHQQPGYHRTETSAYRIPDPDSVLRAWFANGWRHALGKSKTLAP